MELQKRFLYPLGEPGVKKQVEEISKVTGLSMLESAIFYNRGIEEISEIASMIDKSLDELEDPSLMKDGVVAAQAIIDSIDAGEEITLYSDYDADGWGSSVVGDYMFAELGVKINTFSNTRDMGYGMCPEGVDKILELYPNTKLIVTADNGIVAFDAVDYAISKGLKVVVTDHHQPSPDGRMTNAIANVNPHREDCPYPFKELCGAAILWKVLSLCFFMKGIPYKRAYKYLDIVAVATVADVVSLTGENRIICHHGLKLITEDCRIQWKIFKDVFSDYNKIESVDSRTIGFTFGPAINAVSRMQGSIQKAIDIFLTNDEDKIRTLVTELKNVNKERKLLTEDFCNIAMQQASMQDDYPIVIINDAEFFEGVVGLVAGRVKEVIHKPVIALTSDHKGNWKGSGRSIEGYHIKDALDVVQAETGLLKAYGGHSQACGLTVSDENLEDFRFAMIDNAFNIPPEAFIKNVVVDYEAKESEIDAHFFDKIKNLEPFGNGFEDPIIGIRDFVPNEVKFIGSDNQHLILKGKYFDVVSWYGAKVVEDGIPTSFTVCGRLERDNFGIKLMVEPEDIQI